MRGDRLAHLCGIVFLAVVGLAGCTTAPQSPDAAAAPRPVKVLIVSMFKPEGDVWVKPLALDQEIPVPGLSPDYPVVRCNAQDVCLVTTGMGHANAAASVTALIFSRRFDLSRTYFLVAGIAGIDPKRGTIGSAAWARYLVDYGIAHEVDAREMPRSWRYGYFGIDTKNPDTKPPLAYRTEVFKLDEGLLQWALALSAGTSLTDDDTARRYRRHYTGAGARPPSVLQCDTASGDTYWHGVLLGARAEEWTRLLTDGQGTYCTTQQEDNASYEALKRGAGAGLLDIARVAVLRTGANFDRPHKGQTDLQSLSVTSGGFKPAVDNLVVAGKPLVDEITTHWDAWQAGVPKR